MLQREVGGLWKQNQRVQLAWGTPEFQGQVHPASLSRGQDEEVETCPSHLLPTPGASFLGARELPGGCSPSATS